MSPFNLFSLTILALFLFLAITGLPFYRSVKDNIKRLLEDKGYEQIKLKWDYFVLCGLAFDITYEDELGNMYENYCIKIAFQDLLWREPILSVEDRLKLSFDESMAYHCQTCYMALDDNWMVCPYCGSHLT